MIGNRIGQILIAEPFMEDPNFRKGVILICDDGTENGTLGFILNKPLDVKVEGLILDFPKFEEDMYFGGPVGHDTVHYVHTLGHTLDGAVPIRDGLYWGGDFEKLKYLISNGKVTGEDIKFFVGYSGWSVGQLDGELKSGSWVVDDMDNDYLINIPPEELWKSTMQNKSDSHAIIAEIPDVIHYN